MNTVWAAELPYDASTRTGLVTPAGSLDHGQVTTRIASPDLPAIPDGFSPSAQTTQEQEAGPGMPARDRVRVRQP